MNDNELARIYFDHHAEETDRRSQRRLTELMRKAIEHDARCQTEDCPISLHSFLAGDVVVHTAFNEELLRFGLPEDDSLRQRTINARYLLHIYFPKTGRSYHGLFVS